VSPREGAPRAEKVAVVTEVRDRLESSSAALLTEYRGLKVGEMADLRRQLRAVGGDYKVYKNSLVRFAVRDLGIDLSEELLTGPTAIAFVDGDAAAVAKALRDYGRTNPALVVKGGVLGLSPLTAEGARALADLPSRDVLLARLAGAFAAPMQQFAGLLAAVPRNFAYGLQALLDSRGGAPAEDGSPAEDETIADLAPPEEAPDTGSETVPTETAGDEPVAPEPTDPPAEEAS
jgi:large subunit ribosomal protein L10